VVFHLWATRRSFLGVVWHSTYGQHMDCKECYRIWGGNGLDDAMLVLICVHCDLCFRDSILRHGMRGVDNKNALIYCIYEIDMIDLARQPEVTLHMLRHLFARKITLILMMQNQFRPKNRTSNYV
jgi:hypothetical protein